MSMIRILWLCVDERVHTTCAKANPFLPQVIALSIVLPLGFHRNSPSHLCMSTQ